MEQTQPAGAVSAFMKQLRQNGVFLLMVLMATGALLYFVIGLSALLGR